MDKTCPICKIRVSNSADANGKTVRVEGMVIHKQCVSDLILKHCN